MPVDSLVGEHQMTPVRQVADSLQDRLANAERLRLLLDFWFATGLRPASWSTTSSEKRV